MITEWELWACANEAIDQHGLDAPIFAAMRADQLFEEGDEDGARTWRLIMRRVNELLQPQTDKQPH